MRATASEMGPLLLARLLILNTRRRRVCSPSPSRSKRLGAAAARSQASARDTAAHGRARGGDRDQVRQRRRPALGAIQRRLLALEQQAASSFRTSPRLTSRTSCRPTRAAPSCPRGRSVAADPGAVWDVPALDAGRALRTTARGRRSGAPQARLLRRSAPAVAAPKALTEQIERAVRLIGSKGVGIYFVMQDPLDLPDVVRGQLGHRIQHTLRACTPQHQKAVRAAAGTFRANPQLDVATAITELGVGETLVSVLDEAGTRIRCNARSMRRARRWRRAHQPSDAGWWEGAAYADIARHRSIAHRRTNGARSRTLAIREAPRAPHSGAVDRHQCGAQHRHADRAAGWCPACSTPCAAAAPR